MNKAFFRFLFLSFSLLLSCFSGELPKKPYVLVSVAPHKFFVEKIAEDLLEVILMVPPGASSHSYEPTPKQMVNASKGEIWFLLGEPFEQKAAKALKSYNSQLKLVDMRQGLDLISDQCGHCKHHHHSMDPHIWLSPSMAKIQAATIAKTLSQYYPEHGELFQRNLESFSAELEHLDRKIDQVLQPLKNRTIMVSHPAYGYFCRDYQLQQLSIEFEGKDPTPKQLNTILSEARENNIRAIFIQQQYSNKAANLVAKELNVRIIDLDPYAENILESLFHIAQSFAQNGTEP
ncbi:hypothetical protein PHSC3_001616 [Chlamydiales bacterium STE3]|nr:hypothetical protein PHSC3_001616 [Chlamydiales bacterium STE3]